MRAGTDHVQNAVALQPLPLRRVRDDVAGRIEGIVERHYVAVRIHQLLEVAGAELIERRGHQSRGLAVASGGPLVSKKEECLVAAVEDLRDIYRTAEAAARIPLPHDRALGGRRGESARVEHLVAVEHERTAVSLVRARLGHPVDHAVRSAAVLGGVRRVLHFELLHAFHAHAVHGRIVASLAVRLRPVELFALPVQQSAADARIVVGADHPRREDHKRKVRAQAAADEQRQIFDHILGEHLAEVRALHVEQRRGGADSATRAMFIATSASRLLTIRPSSVPNRRAAFSALTSAITSVTSAWPNSAPPEYATTFLPAQPALCGKDLSDPSADSERLTCRQLRELRKTG
jgi:hypothetical protein